jgi:hypothetical protein
MLPVCGVMAEAGTEEVIVALDLLGETPRFARVKAAPLGMTPFKGTFQNLQPALWTSWLILIWLAFILTP